MNPLIHRPRHRSRFAGRRCTAWGCRYADLVWMKKGDARQTSNGFLIAKIAGWYCPKCAGGYGGTR